MSTTPLVSACLRGCSADEFLLAETLHLVGEPTQQSGQPEDLSFVGRMRRLARARLISAGLAGLADDAELVVSELVTNAVVHSGGSEVTLTLRLHESHLEIWVHDGVAGDHHPVRPAVEAYDEGGRGLHLVAAVAACHGGSWGLGDQGATTWCRLAVAT
ncbi:ATP-binding protein [Streptomyces sp. NPDC046985]|uniref:ATP-binding protein n=1 Tax=Streptomyces sp. NPDC046985 TaxID=3155377 RepID=UPI0033F90E89